MTATTMPGARTTPPDGHGVGISASAISKRHPDGTTALDEVTLTIRPGRLTAIVGPSGAGKTTLLAALARVTTIDRGTVSYLADAAADNTGIGFVPQDDILHGELPLRRTLRYAISLRMSAPATALDDAVSDAMETLGLSGLDDVPVHSLSGGQRKRASIACEILTRPAICFLDEPTSGLDPAAASSLIALLERMAEHGSTIVLTTHSIADIERSDEVVVLAPGGRIAATGTPADVLHRLGAANFSAVYEQLAQGEQPQVPSQRAAEPVRTPRVMPRVRERNSHRPSAVSQWLVLTRRAADILTRNRLTLAILVGSPTAVIAMFAVLFRRGAASTDPAAAVQVAYWLSFAGFFFGLTFGLLQVCTEIPVLRRERQSGMRIGSYLASKIALLMPVLLVVNAAMLLVLRLLDRIPSLSAHALTALYLTMALDALAALCLGLLASAAVTSTAQAALALPMLCFPAVLFSGAMVPLPVMATAGRTIAAVMSDRWAFEGIAHHLRVAAVTGPQSPYASLGSSAAATYWMLLGLFAVIFAGAAYTVIRRRAARGVG
jgi:ABC-type multidrug transport system ATPase subunit